MNRGRHIAFTGTDGSGKSTQAGLLTRRLNDGGEPAYLAEHKDDFTVQVLRRVLDENDPTAIRRRLGHDVVNVVNALDVLRDHARTALPLLTAGTTVVSPRSPYCRLAVALAHGATDVDLVERILTLYGPPDLVIWLDLPADTTVARVEARGRDREDEDFMARLRDAITRLAPTRSLHRVDALGSPAEVHDRVWAAVAGHRAG